MMTTIKALIGKHGTSAAWQKITRTQMKALPAGTSLAITTAPRLPSGHETHSTTFTVYRPPRGKRESPVAYYKRTKCVDDRFHHNYRGRYYCNPAHCAHSWLSKKERDAHLKAAYSALD